MPERPRLLVTGATGFVGRAVCERLAAEGAPFQAASRHGMRLAGGDTHSVGDLGPETDWRAALEGCTVVLHLAARVHVMNETARSPLDEFRRINVESTLALARQAATAGVRRFVYVSTAKVNGEWTHPGQAFTAQDVPKPDDPYAISKHEAEQGLRMLSAETGMEVVVVRPPLVYGPGVKANFANLMRWVARGRPLPLGAITHNRRSLVGLGNLVDLLLTCVTHPAAPGQVFLVSDGEDLSTAELVRRMAKAVGREPLLLSVPESWLRWAADMAGRSGAIQRLCGSLQLDISSTRDVLAWLPPVPIETELARTARALALPGDSTSIAAPNP